MSTTPQHPPTPPCCALHAVWPGHRDTCRSLDDHDHAALRTLAAGHADHLAPGVATLARAVHTLLPEP